MERKGATCGSEVVRLPPMLKVRGSTLGHVGRDADFDHQYVSPVTRTRHQGFSLGTPASSPSSLEIVQPITKIQINAILNSAK